MNVPIFLAHDPDMRARYYGERALAGLRALGPVVLNPTDRALTAPELIEAAGNARIIVADRMTVGPAEVFAALPDLAAFVRVAVDIRNIDVPAASAAGVLVTQASPGFAAAVAELGDRKSVV
jgi:D-3-phosphoglycerate dehydrogenase